jgi:hypothetical protein
MLNEELRVGLEVNCRIDRLRGSRFRVRGSEFEVRGSEIGKFGGWEVRRLVGFEVWEFII